MSNLRILSLNCRSLVSNSQRLQLQNYLAQHKPEIAFLQETRLGVRHRIRIAGYTLVYLPIAPSAQPKGNDDVGTAIALREGTQHTIVQTPLTLGFGTFAEISVSGNKVLQGSVYFHNLSVPSAKSAFSELGEFANIYSSVIIGGDLNATLSPLNSNGKGLESILLDDNLNISLISPDKPTFLRCGNILDHFLMKDEQNFLTSPHCTTIDLFSDHCGILLHVGTNIVRARIVDEDQTLHAFEDFYRGLYSGSDSNPQEGWRSRSKRLPPY